MTAHWIATRRAAALLLALAASAPALAQHRGSLYQASANGHTMLLFGTAHLTDPAAMPTDPVLIEAIKTASTLYVESDAAPSIWKLAYLFKEPTYARLPPATRQRLAAQLQRAGIPEGLALRLSPLALAAYLEAKLCMGRVDQDTVDLRLAALARSRQVPVIQLERPNDTMDLVNGMPAEAKLDLIEQAVAKAEAPGYCADVHAALRNWLDGDVDKLDAEVRQSRDDASPSARFVYATLLRKRDAGMAPKIADALARQDKAVVAIGASHLSGEGSVVDLLRARGIAVERLY